MQQDILINWSPQETRVAVVENGVVKTLAYDRFWAQKQGVAPTRSGGGGFGAHHGACLRRQCPRGA